jgi:zinc transport system substrate-binding protein
MAMTRQQTGIFVIGITLVAWACSGCKQARDAAEETDLSLHDQLSVYVVNYPLQYFAQRIGGDLVDVHFPAPRDVDPVFWQPSVEVIADYQSADLILLNGANYARWVNNATLPPSKLVDTSAAMSDRFISVENDITHQHGPTGEHSHSGIAFTTWLDPTIAIEQALAIKDAFCRLLPDHQVMIETRFEELSEDLRGVDSQLEQLFADNKQQPVLFSHPVYQYFIRRYGLNARSVHWEPNVLPDDGAWTELKSLVSDHRAQLLIWEGPPMQQSINKLKVMGIDSEVFQPCGNVPKTGNYLSVMTINFEALSGWFLNKTTPQ